MKAIQNAAASVRLGGHVYPIAYNTDIKAGMVVKLSGGLVVAAAQAETGAILGIAAENHPGTADALNPRANGTEIMIFDNPLLIFECDAPVFSASGGSATTVTAASSAVASSTADIFNNGILQLVEKASGSTNTDALLCQKKITDYAQADSVSTFTVASAGTAVSGDKFRVYPPIGGTAGCCALDSDKVKFILSTAGCTKIKVVGHDYERGKIKLMAVEHAIGVEN